MKTDIKVLSKTVMESDKSYSIITIALTKDEILSWISKFSDMLRDEDKGIAFEILHKTSSSEAEIVRSNMDSLGFKCKEDLYFAGNGEIKFMLVKE